MPKIAAATVAEHRAQVAARLVDAAEAILRTDPTQHLTASAVTSAAGIARNSIYRYVDSVDDLKAMVVDRYLPDWLAAVAAAMGAAHSPAARIVAWVEVNLRQAATTGHGWLMEAARAAAPSGSSSSMDGAVAEAHTGMRDSLGAAWAALLDDADRARVAAALTVGILDAGFRQLDAGRPIGLVVEMGGQAAKALVETYAPQQPSS